MTLKITIDNRLRFREADVSKDVIKELCGEFTHNNPQYQKLVALGHLYNKEPKKLVTWKRQGEMISFPRGGIFRLRKILDDNDVEFDEIDCRTRGEQLTPHTGDWVTPQIIPDHRLKMRPHQERIIEALMLRKQALVRSPTGSGKTSALLAAIARIQLPSLVIVWDSRLLEQWQERIEQEMGIPRKQQGLIQGKTKRLTSLTLAMQQTLTRIPERELRDLLGKFALVAGDEIQRAAANTYEYVFDNVTSFYKVGVSADERRKDGKDPLIYDQFGEVVCSVDMDELVAAGHVVDVCVRMIPTTFHADWYRAEDDEGHKESPDFPRLLDEMTKNDERNRLIVEQAAARATEGRTMFLFTHRVEHARVLDSMLTSLGIRTGLMLGGPENRAEFNATKTALGKGTKSIGIGTYQAIGVGQDIPNVDAGIAATPIHNNRQNFGQVKGRMCRSAEGKTEGTLYYMYDRFVFDAQPVRNLSRWSNDVRVLDGDIYVPATDYVKSWRVGYDAEAKRHAGNPGPFQNASSVRRSRRA